MDLFQKFYRRTEIYVVALLVTQSALMAAIWYVLVTYTALDLPIIACVSFAAGSTISLFIALVIVSRTIKPVRTIWEAVQRLNAGDRSAIPQTADLTGGEMITNLTAQIYQLTAQSQQENAEKLRQQADPSHNFIAQNVPLPLILLDNTETVLFANTASAAYLGIDAADLIGKNVYMAMDMSFPSADTFDTWLKQAKVNSATATKSWERVRLNIRDNHPERLFDLAAYYNRNNPERVETIVALFDHTKQYSQDEQAVSFVALAVHELRTPLTLLRGYIEVLDEELGGKVSPELEGFMQKMRSQADQLTAFVNNILNVARIEDDQLELKLESGDWSTILKAAIQSLSLQAKVRGITLRCRLATDLPAVGVDRLSIQEVFNNLIDNAIKYSGDSKVINITTRLDEHGMIETSVQDFGVGIATGILPKLFTKFYRDHRNRAQIGGTGLGLYLSKTIVTAHGGDLWVRSKEGEGSTFGFTLLPYAKLAEAQKLAGNQELARTAHGWIKNHSLYRR